VFAVFLYFFCAALTDLALGLKRNDSASVSRNLEPVRTVIRATISAGGQTARRDRRRSRKHCKSENTEENNRFYEQSNPHSFLLWRRGEALARSHSVAVVSQVVLGEV
jgi:hypothetical protein